MLTCHEPFLDWHYSSVSEWWGIDFPETTSCCGCSWAGGFVVADSIENSRRFFPSSHCYNSTPNTNPPFGPSSLSPSSPSTVTESPYLPDSYIAQHPDSYTSSLRPENSSIRVIFLEAFSCSIKQHLLPYWNETKAAIQLWKYVAKPLKSQWTTILTATIALWFANPVAFANNSISRKHREY